MRSSTAFPLEAIEQLEELERLESYLIALVGYELWTPLSTIQVTLESLASEPEMPAACQQVLLEIALTEVTQLQQMIQQSLNSCQLEGASPHDSSRSSNAQESTLHDTLMKAVEQYPSKSILNTHGLRDETPQPLFLSTPVEGGDSAGRTSLEVLEHKRNNIVAIVGHELRTPISTIQVCLESLASQPQIPPHFRTAMLEIALADVGRLHQLIKDFFILSRFQRGLVYHRPEQLNLSDAVDLALMSLRLNRSRESFPQILVKLPPPIASHSSGWGQAGGSPENTPRQRLQIHCSQRLSDGPGSPLATSS